LEELDRIEDLVPHRVGVCALPTFLKVGSFGSWIMRCSRAFGRSLRPSKSLVQQSHREGRESPVLRVKDECLNLITDGKPFAWVSADVNWQFARGNAPQRSKAAIHEDLFVTDPSDDPSHRMAFVRKFVFQ